MVVASGSVAFDYILTFAGSFADHILPDRRHILNLSFLVDSLEKRRGGVAANYAYNFALLETPAALLATVGPDASDYAAWLAGRGIDCSGLRILPDTHTATGFTTTDRDDNQLTGYYGGAMLRAAEIGLADTVAGPDAVIIGPNAPAAMARLVGECRTGGLRWVYDPAHQLPHLEGADLEDGARGAWIVIGNDYEMELISKRTGRDEEGLLELTGIVVTTLGAAGSRIVTRHGAHDIPAAPARQVADPTGAGDAYRAGLVAALLAGADLPAAGRVGSLAAAYAVEQVGTIEHTYSLDGFRSRYGEAFGAGCPL